MSSWKMPATPHPKKSFKKKLNCKSKVSLSSHGNQAVDVVIIHLNERQQRVYPQAAPET